MCFLTEYKDKIIGLRFQASYGNTRAKAILFFKNGIQLQIKSLFKAKGSDVAGLAQTIVVGSGISEPPLEVNIVRNSKKCKLGYTIESAFENYGAIFPPPSLFTGHWTFQESPNCERLPIRCRKTPKLGFLADVTYRIEQYDFMYRIPVWNRPNINAMWGTNLNPISAIALAFFIREAHSDGKISRP